MWHTCPALVGRKAAWRRKGLVQLLVMLFLLLDLRLGLAKEAKKRMYQGVDVSKHVPKSVLPPGSMVQVIDVHYK